MASADFLRRRAMSLSGLEQATVGRLEAQVAAALSRLGYLKLGVLEPRQWDGGRLQQGVLSVVQVTGGSGPLKARLPVEGDEGQELGVMFRTGEGVVWVYDGDEVVAAVHNDSQFAIFRRVLGAWVPVVGRLEWNDVLGAVQNGTGAASLSTAAYRDTGFRLYHFSSNQNDILSFAYQMPHGWARTPVRPHVHVLPTASATGTVFWRAYYTWSLTGSGQEVPALADWTRVEWEQPLTPADQYTESATSPGLITPPDWADASAHLLVHWERRAGTSFDTYNQVLPLLSFDVHVQVSTHGTVVEFPGGANA